MEDVVEKEEEEEEEEIPSFTSCLKSGLVGEDFHQQGDADGEQESGHESHGRRGEQEVPVVLLPHTGIQPEDQTMLYESHYNRGSKRLQ